jgi:hypothetical protein
MDKLRLTQTAKMSLTGMKIARVGDDYIQLENSFVIYLDQNEINTFGGESMEKTFMIIDRSGRGFTSNQTFSQLKDNLAEELTGDGELVIRVLDDLDLGDSFDCDNIIDSEFFTACEIIRVI